MGDTCKNCGSGKGEMFLTNPPFHVDKDQCIRYLRAELVAVEKHVQAARDIIAKRLRNCAGNFHEENPGGCTGSCESFGCKTLRGIRDTLKE